jgi:hypothetical protein
LGQGEMMLSTINGFLSASGQKAKSPRNDSGSLPECRRQEFQTDYLFWLSSPSELEGKHVVFVNLRLQH